MGAALRFKNITVAKQAGELGRFRVLGGPDHGSVFVVNSPKVTVGRGKENDIILSDIKVSRKHFEVFLSKDIANIKDLGSSHGTLINGQKQSYSVLNSGDKIGIGETVLEFFISGQPGSQLMMLEPLKTVSEVGTGSSGFTKFIPNPNYNSANSKTKPTKTLNTETFLERNKKVLLLLAALMAVAILLPTVEKKQNQKKAKYTDPDEIKGAIDSVLNPIKIEPTTKKQSEFYFKEGFREYRARNYTRAQASFETALQIWVDHPLARIYLEKTKQSLKEESEELLIDAKRDEDSRRFRGAMQKYDAVKRLYSRDQSNPAYKEADLRVTELQKKLKEMGTE